MHLSPEQHVHHRVFKTGALTYNSGQGMIPIARILFDSGALSSSYMCKSFVDAHRDELNNAGCILPEFSEVTLGDNSTRVPITEAVHCSIIVRDSRGRPVRLASRFAVIPTGPDVIVGLPDIVRKVLALFIDMLVSEDLPSESSSGEDASSLQNIYPRSDELVYPSDAENLPIGFSALPWKSGPTLAPEELETPEISLFPIDSLANIDSERAEQVAEYLAMIPDHVDADFARAHPEFIEYMRSEEVTNLFVPTNWDGVKGIPEVEFVLRPDTPDHFRAHSRAVHPARQAHVRAELQRLIDRGILVPSPRSPYVSAIVDADKATAPFVRICGAYNIEANKHIIPEQASIPPVLPELQKFKGYSFFIDIDLTHSFRQFRLAQKTSTYLSITTKDFGILRPVFMPEGVTPATAVLQTYVQSIFQDFDSWLVNIFDNFTICCYDYEDGIAKFKQFVDRCRERNLFLQFKKTWIMIREVSFFGYICNGEGFRLADSRKQAVMDLPFPDGHTQRAKQKAAQSMQGFLQYFRDLVPGFSELSAPLTDMTHANFNWDPSSWTLDYRQAIDVLKAACVASMMSYYPDLSLPWFLIPDASQRAVGAILVQVRPLEGDATRHEMIGCVSQKLSDTAQKWDTIKRECYAIFFGITRLGYFLRHRPFVVLTDHQNLQWIEHSTVAIIVRWRLIMSGYPILAIKHIPGKINPADYLTRDGAPALPLDLFPPDATVDGARDALSCLLAFTEGFDELHASPPPSSSPADPEEYTAGQYAIWQAMFDKIHGKSSLHWGIAETWRRFQLHFPGSGIPYRVVVEFVQRCPICQKYRLASNANRLEPIIRTLKAPGPRGRTSADVIEISPPAEDGTRYIYVLVNICTGLAFGHATKTKTMFDAADAMTIYISLYGLTTTFITDPGSDFTSDLMQCLAQYFGTRYSFTLVDRPQANGVEPVNKQILRHLRTLVADYRLAHCWHKPRVLAVIFASINSAIKSEHGIDSFTATFGSLDTPFFMRPENLPADASALSQDYVRELDVSIQAARETVFKTHQDIIAVRTAPNSARPQNFFQPGDLVLVDLKQSRRQNKLQAPKLGPYEVVSHDKNDVLVRDLHSGLLKPAYDVSIVSLYDGTRQEAFELSMHDKNEYVIERFCRFRGNPETRTTIEFDVLFSDGSRMWLPWSPSLFQTIPYEIFCRSDPMLTPLLESAADGRQRIADLKRQPITLVQPQDHVFVNLRYYSHTWYKELDSLGDRYDVAYLVPCRYGRLLNKNRKIELLDDVFGNRFVVDNAFVHHYGWCTDLATHVGPYTLVDKAFKLSHPQLHDTRPQISHMVSLPLPTDSPMFVLQRYH